MRNLPRAGDRLRAPIARPLTLAEREVQPTQIARANDLWIIVVGYPQPHVLVRIVERDRRLEVLLRILQFASGKANDPQAHVRNDLRRDMPMHPCQTQEFVTEAQRRLEFSPAKMTGHKPVKCRIE